MAELSKRRETFKRLAENRVSKALHTHQLIANLANKTNYDYSSADADKIIAALEQSVKEIKVKFKNNEHIDSVEFKLD